MTARRTGRHRTGRWWLVALSAMLSIVLAGLTSASAHSGSTERHSAGAATSHVALAAPALTGAVDDRGSGDATEEGAGLGAAHACGVCGHPPLLRNTPALANPAPVRVLRQGIVADAATTPRPASLPLRPPRS